MKHVYKLVLQANVVVSNVDLTIIAQQPKLSPHLKEMIENIAEDLQVELSQINIKATTTEGLGYIGREEGIAVHAVVLVESSS